MPVESEEEEENHKLIFDPSKTEKIKRKASEQESAIIAKQPYETLNTNKVKKRRSAMGFNDEKDYSVYNETPQTPKTINVSYRVPLQHLK